MYNSSAEYPACCGKVVCDPVEGNEIDVGKSMLKSRIRILEDPELMELLHSEETDCESGSSLLS